MVIVSTQVGVLAKGRMAKGQVVGKGMVMSRVCRVFTEVEAACRSQQRV
jgi:hypothetical protein